MKLHHHITGLTFSTLFVLTVAALATPASADEWSTISDDLCTDCASYADADVASGTVVSAYKPGVGYPVQTVLSGSERYRAEICAGQYACDEDGSWSIGEGTSTAIGENANVSVNAALTTLGQ